VNALLVHHSPAALRLVLVYECLHLKYNPSSQLFERKLEELEPDWKMVLDKMNAVPIPRE
jgi:predicted metal-dependent hydrolase